MRVIDKLSLNTNISTQLWYQSWRRQVWCKTVLIRKVMNFTEKGSCKLMLTDWELMLYMFNFVLWEVILTLMPLRAARLAAQKWHQIQSMGLFLADHMRDENWHKPHYNEWSWQCIGLDSKRVFVNTNSHFSTLFLTRSPIMAGICNPLNHVQSAIWFPGSFPYLIYISRDINVENQWKAWNMWTMDTDFFKYLHISSAISVENLLKRLP